MVKGQCQQYIRFALYWHRRIPKDHRKDTSQWWYVCVCPSAHWGIFAECVVQLPTHQAYIYIYIAAERETPPSWQQISSDSWQEWNALEGGLTSQNTSVIPVLPNHWNARPDPGSLVEDWLCIRRGHSFMMFDAPWIGPRSFSTSAGFGKGSPGAGITSWRLGCEKWILHAVIWRPEMVKAANHFRLCGIFFYKYQMWKGQNWYILTILVVVQNWIVVRALFVIQRALPSFTMGFICPIRLELGMSHGPLEI